MAVPVPAPPRQPLLPVHHVKVAKRKAKGKALMRMVIFGAILLAVGYAVFAIKHIQSSADRHDAITHQARGKGRTLAVNPNTEELHKIQQDEEELEQVYSDEVLGEDDGAVQTGTATTTASVQTQSPEKKPTATVQPQPTPTPNRQPQQQLPQQRQQPPQQTQKQPQQQAQQQQQQAQHQAQQQASKQAQQQQQQQVQQQAQQLQGQKQAQQTQPQQQQGQKVQAAGGQEPAGGTKVPAVQPVLKARTETERHEARVEAPGLAVGSRIEADSHTGAARAPGLLTEPDLQPKPVISAPHDPVPVKGAEPDPHQEKAQVVAPQVKTGPQEAERVPLKAPDGTPASPIVIPVTKKADTDAAPSLNPHATGLYALSAVDIDGKMRSLSEFAGKVTLVVNVASACGYTDENYKGLEDTYHKYHEHGLEILGFPCNQFGKQESGSEAEIKAFCTSKYHVTFPMFAKVDVNGPNTHPVYQFLKRELPASEGGGGGTGTGRDLVWNFQKILVNHKGQPVKYFFQSYDQGAVETEIYKLLHEALDTATS